ncbi:MAG TPA: phosphate signaling complex protein PhoU [Ktedonobacterales bacterium]|nr:phosphate signaling complex protein PhoU [Ktedonobacterales bacterium]
MPREAFHQELETLEADALKMGALVERALAEATDALVTLNGVEAQSALAIELEINELHRMIRVRSITTMTLQAPVARDLRALATVQQVSAELERMGDHAAGIAKRVARIRAAAPPALRDDPAIFPTFEALGARVGAQIHAVINAYAAGDDRQARAIAAQDAEVNTLYHTVVAALVAAMTRDPATVQAASDLLFVAQGLERIGDRVTNICEDIIFLVTAEIEELN